MTRRCPVARPAVPRPAGAAVDRRPDQYAGLVECLCGAVVVVVVVVGVVELPVVGLDGLLESLEPQPAIATVAAAAASAVSMAVSVLRLIRRAPIVALPPFWRPTLPARFPALAGLWDLG